ncbi:hypothetical protein [Microbispora sp. NBRC 16548]|uniref:hypothetical protein n=1 Tax=Microbispora sp. NBRC 16548 TaxID=3030994 RepID=UPI00249FC5EB|nr:hypothetical protein [Microbispora sp. NBRC 16548]GLX06596.1 hypothetical protein Misp03_35230 [Microbispora sp. NBRC 16548]
MDWGTGTRLSITSAAAGVLAAALMARRALEWRQICRSRSWDQPAPPPPEPGAGAEPRVVCIVPLYLEQDLVAETVRFWHELAQQNLVDQVLLVTTAKERSERETTTRDLVDAELRRRGTGGDRITLLHCEQVTRYRAAQLNLAVEWARARFLREGSQETAMIWIGVYNADSRPEKSTFTELRGRIAAEPSTRIFQQLVDYVVPERGRPDPVAVGNALLQTWWTLSHYVGRNRRGYPGTTVWSRTSPYSTFGHGEFVRLDFLDDIGGFPDFAYADGLLLGWIGRLMVEPIGLLASRDVAEVPRSAADLITQQTAWMRGLLNFPTTVDWCRRQGLLRLPKHEVWLLRAQHLAIPLSWGLSTAAVMAALAALARQIGRGQTSAYDLAILAGLAAYPAIPALAPVADPHREISRGRRVLGAVRSWPLEGLAFWPALGSHLQRSQRAPAKTPR